LNAIIKYSLGWALLYLDCCFFQRNYEFLPETFWWQISHWEQNSKCFNSCYWCITRCYCNLNSIGAGALGTVTYSFIPFGYTKTSWNRNRSRRSINLSSWFRTCLMGNLDLGLLGQLLIGSLPGIFIKHVKWQSSWFIFRNAIAGMLFFVGYKLVFMA
jgi:hypothetical protein